jgi:hypothetical protein
MGSKKGGSIWGAFNAKRAFRLFLAPHVGAALVGWNCTATVPHSNPVQKFLSTLGTFLQK